jgi:hypothetical protein
MQLPTDIRASAVMNRLPFELHTRNGYRDAADGDMGEIRPVVLGVCQLGL